MCVILWPKGCYRRYHMSETIKNLGQSKKVSKRESERRYNQYLDDPVTFAIDEVLQTLGPRQEQIRR